ncbi:MAG: BspA family leucine-rich repeat surface protein [Firmicutes bacterium]|nr:BspA family leucine-rich repeat surface protein [Bacillota bacterium]
MFDSCSSLVSLELNGFDTSKVTSADYMFCNCDNLERLDISGFDMSALEPDRDYYIFANCNKLHDLRLGANFSVTYNMNLPSHAGWVKIDDPDNTGDLPTERVDNPNIIITAINNNAKQWYTTICYEYDEDTKTLTLVGDVIIPDRINKFSKKAEVLAVDTVMGTGFIDGSLEYTFNGYTACKSIDLTNIYGGIEDSSYYINSMRSMFEGCKSLKDIDISNFYTGKCENFSDMFSGCASLKKLYIGNLCKMDCGGIYDII